MYIGQYMDLKEEKNELCDQQFLTFVQKETYMWLQVKQNKTSDIASANISTIGSQLY